MASPAVVHVSTVLDAPADRVWQAVTTPAAFRLVTRGLVRVVGLRRRATPWREGETISGVLLLFGVLPISVHHLTVERLDAGPLTPVVVAYARRFYAVRQRRWRELALVLEPPAPVGPADLHGGPRWG